MAVNSTDYRTSAAPGAGADQDRAAADSTAELAQPAPISPTGSADEGLAEALAHHQSGRADVAERIYLQLLDADPDEPTALYLYGMLSFETGRPDLAGSLFERLVEVCPGQAQGWFALASLRYWQDDHAAAAKAYGRAVVLDPAHVEARLSLVRTLRDAGRFDDAIDACNEAFRLGIDPAGVQALLGGVHLAAGRAADAASAFAAACALDSGNAEARLGLATALIGDGRPADALAASEAAIAADDSLAEAWMLRGVALNALRRPAAAATALERAVELDPGRAAARLDLGNTYVVLDRPADAERQLLAALEIDPALTEALASLGSVYMRAERKTQAERCFRRALDLDPQMVVPHQNLAALTDEQGRPAEARRHREIAYGRQNLFIERAPDPVLTVLVLTAAEGGNIPYRFLLPNDRYTRLDWFIEYARDGDAAELPAYDLVFNAAGDPDLADPIRTHIERFLAGCAKPALNAPAQVARTFRHLTADLLAGVDDVVAPRTVRIEAKDAAENLGAGLARQGLDGPVLLRPIASHGGRGLVRIDGPDALATPPDGDLYATAFHDFRSPDGWHRKYRMIFIDRRPYPYHLAIAGDWMVHHGTANMTDDAGRLAEELKFLADPAAAIGERAMAAIGAIGERLDLDYGGVDFSVLSDGRVLVFEANATMLVHPEAEDGPLAGKNPYVATILGAFADMLGRKSAA